MRGNPRITMNDVARRAALRRPDRLGDARLERRGRISYKDRSIDPIAITGVTGDYVEFASYDVERGRLVSPTEIDRSGRSTVIGWGMADQLFGDDDPIDKIIPSTASTSASSA